MGVEFRQGRGLGWGMTYAGGAVTFERGAGPRLRTQAAGKGLGCEA